MNTKTYRVAEGIGHVNGAPVPTNRKVSLSDQEALFDQALGRITPIRTAKKTGELSETEPEQ